MKTLKLLGVSVLLLCLVSCGNDDDGTDIGKSNQELLIEGIWYQEAISGEDLTDCEKTTSFNFVNTTDIKIETFTDFTGTCESFGTLDATYSLTNDVDLTLSFDGDTVNAVIISIDEDVLVISDDGDTITFDRIPG